MLSRVVVPVGTFMAAAPLFGSTVMAAETPSESRDEPCDHCHSKTLKPSEFSLYGEPPQPELVYVPEPVTKYRETVSTVRKSVWDATAGMQGSIDATKNAVNVANEYLKDAKKRVQEDSGVLQRAGLITVAGLGGIVAGYKGGVIRKTLFAGVAMTTAAAVCYPNQAVEMSSAGLNRVKQEALGLWDQVSNKPSEKSAPEPENKPTPAETSSKDKTIMQEKSDAKPVVPPMEDPGQSRPEDKDLYASRTSK